MPCRSICLGVERDRSRPSPPRHCRAVETGRPALCRYARSVRIRRARKEDHRLAREERPRRWPPLSRWTECPRVARCGRLSVGNGARRRRAGSSGRARIPDARPRRPHPRRLPVRSPERSRRLSLPPLHCALAIEQKPACLFYPSTGEEKCRMSLPTTIPASFADAGHRDRRWWVLVIVVAAQFIFVVDAFIVNVAIPSIRTDVGATTAEIQGVVVLYQIAFATLIITGGRLGDIRGPKPVFLLGLLAFTMASAWCGF